MKNKILITGAGGFIGGHLVEALLAAGYQPESIRLFLWHEESMDNVPHLPFEVYRGDIRDSKDVLQAMKSVKTVFHLAARTDFAGKTLRDYYDTNVVGTQNVLEAGRISGLQKIVFYSSMAVHGIPAEVGPIIGWNERFAPQKPRFTNPYGHSKWIAEQRILQAHRDWGVEYAIIRPTSVYGPREQGPTLALIQAIVRSQYFPVGSGKNCMEYVHVRDLVQGTVQAAESDVPAGTVMMSGSQPVAFQEVVQAVYSALRKPFPRWSVPGWLVWLLSLPLGMAHFFGISVPLYPQRVKTLLSTYIFDTSRAKILYDYQPSISIQEGIQETVDWYRKTKS